MLIPGEICDKLTAETADRLRRGDSFASFREMDPIAQEELHRDLKQLGFKDRQEVGGFGRRNKSLARALIFFAHDSSGDLQAVP